MSLRQPVHSGLRLPTKVGVGQTQEQAIHNKWDTYTEVEKELIDGLGLSVDKPEFGYPGPVTAEQLLTTNSQEYTELYTKHLAWWGYLSPIKARIDAKLLGIKNERTDIEKAVKVAEKQKNVHRDKTEKVTLEEATWNDERYKVLTLEKQRLEQKTLIMGSFLEVLERNLAVISRQVTIRGQEIEQTRLENQFTQRPSGHRIPNWGGRGPGGQGGP